MAAKNQECAVPTMDVKFSHFIDRNMDFILSNTPFNPSISRDDEWVKENDWDKYNRHLREK